MKKKKYILGKNIRIGRLVTCIPYGISWDGRPILYNAEFGPDSNPLPGKFPSNYCHPINDRVSFFPIFRVIKRIKPQRYLLRQICKFTWGNPKDLKSFFVNETDDDFEVEMDSWMILPVTKAKRKILKFNGIKLYENLHTTKS